MRLMRHQYVDKGCRILRQGDDATSLVFLVEGEAIMCMVDENKAKVSLYGCRGGMEGGEVTLRGCKNLINTM